MSIISLQAFVTRVRDSQRISFGDLRRLRRDILPGRLTTPDEAELLLALDGAVQKADPDWMPYLVTTVRDFVVWGMVPLGIVDQTKAEWLLSASQGSKAGRAIAREVVEYACEVDTALLAGLSRSRVQRQTSAQAESGAETEYTQAELPEIETGRANEGMSGLSSGSLNQIAA